MAAPETRARFSEDGSSEPLVGTRAPLSAGARQAARVRRRLALFVVATVTVAAGFALAVGLVDSTSDDDGATATDDDAAPPAASGCAAFCLYLESDAYGQVHANAEGLYPWQVVEPFRETTLSLYGSTYDAFARNGARTPPAAGTGIGVIRWSVRKEGADAQAANHTRMEGSQIRYRFEHPGSAYTVSATLRRSATDALVTELRETVLCKYVKREIRAMTAADRRALFRAYNVLYRTADMAAGVATYGPDFRTSLYFVEKHMDRMTKNGCTPYHDSAVFLPAHLAFNLEFDRALQAVDRTVVNAYWDYTVDAENFGKEWYARSPLFTDDFFGADPETYNNGTRTETGAEHVVATGPFAYVPVWTGGPAAPEHNAFYKITDADNYNPSRFVQRSSRISGLVTRARLPGCQVVRGALASTSLDWLHRMVEDYFHAELHAILGGAWGSKLDLGNVCGHLERACAVEMATNDTYDGGFSSCESIKYLEDWAANINVFSRAAFAAARANTTAMRAWYSCPDARECAAFQTERRGERVAPGGDLRCQCSSPALVNRNGSAPDYRKAFKLLDRLGLTDAFTSRFGSDLPADVVVDDAVEYVVDGNGTAERVNVTTVAFDGLSTQDAALVWSTLAEWIAAPPRFGPMSATLGAPNDPLFWVVHNAWERLWAKKLLTPDLTFRFDWSWDNSSDACWGYGYHAVLPFFHLLSDAARPEALNETRGYTNEELMLLFDPSNPKLPYVYETLAFDHCGDREKLAAEVKGLYERSRAAPVDATAGTWPWDTDDEDVARVMRRGDISHRLWGIARQWGAATA